MSAANPLPVVAEPVRTALRLLIVGSLLLAVLYILLPFLPSMLWSAFIVIAVWPGLTWLKNRLHWNRTACALLLAAALIGFVIGPLLAGILALAEHGETLVLDTKAAIESIPDTPPVWVADLPAIGPWLAQVWREGASGYAGLGARFGPMVKANGLWLLGQVGAVGELLLQFLLVVVFALVFYLNGEALDQMTRRLAERLGGEQALQARDQARQAIRAVALGVVLTAFLQAGLALLGLLIAGTPMAILLAFVCFLLAIAQFGAALPLLAVAGWLYWGQGEAGWALFMAVWGLVVVGGVDNVVRPLLMTRGMSMPLTLVFLGVIGGLLAYGLIGVFLGPILVVAAYTLLLAWLAEPQTN